MKRAPTINIPQAAKFHQRLARALRLAGRSSIASLAIVGVLAAAPAGAAAEEAFDKLIGDGKILLNARARFESVDQDSFTRDANGLTLRVRFGYETGSYMGLRFLVEGDATRDLAANDFNSTVNGKTQFPVIADPDSTRLNRGQIMYTGFPDTTFIGGRQRIKLDNDRFIGNVGWRQNEQTFDAVLVSNKSLRDLTLRYAYIWQVNRIFGSKSAKGRLDTGTHILHGSYTGLSFAKITGYAYLIDIPAAPALSSRTLGVRVAGSRDVGNGMKVSYLAEYATQADYQSNPGNFTVDYVALSGGLAWSNLTAKITWERLEGNATNAFATPLATLHAFQGFADVFLSTPATGLSDVYGQVSYTIKDLPSVGDIKLSGWYHDFTSDVGSFDEGEEIDLLASIAPWKGVSLAIKYAAYNGTLTRPDVSKFWLMAGYKF